MNKRVVKLEVENKELRVKCEKSDVSIINMLDEVQHRCKSSSSLRVAHSFPILLHVLGQLLVANRHLWVHFFSCSQRAAMKKQVDLVTSQRDRLEGLCRMLQAERKSTSEVGTPPAGSNTAESEGDEAKKSSMDSSMEGAPETM